MTLVVHREPALERVLPAADESVVFVDGAVPVNVVSVIGVGIGHWKALPRRAAGVLASEGTLPVDAGTSGVPSQLLALRRQRHNSS